MRIRIYITLALLSFCCYKIKAQVITTGTGESSILIQNTNIAFNLGESELSFNTNNRTQTLKSKPIGLTWGGRISAKNKSGIGAFFNNDKLLPSSQGSVILGVYFSNVDKLYASINEDYAILRAQSEKDLEGRLKVQLDALQNYLITNSTTLTPVEVGDLNGVIVAARGVPVNYIQQLKDDLDAYTKNPAKTVNAKNVALKFLNAFNSLPELKEATEIQQEIGQESAARIRFLKDKMYYKLNAYLHGGLRAEKFKVFDNWNTEDLSKSYSDIHFKGGNFGVGINYRYGGKWILGFKYTYDENNNSALLTDTEFTYVVEQSAGNSKITTTDKFNAFSGQYSRVYLNRFDVDLLRFIPLGKKDFLMLDGYIRATKSNDDEIYTSTTDIGLSSLFFKKDGKFMGGVYAEVPDVNQKVESLKESPDYKEWYKRLSFGIYARFSFNSLLGLE